MKENDFNPFKSIKFNMTKNGVSIMIIAYLINVLAIKLFSTKIIKDELQSMSLTYVDMQVLTDHLSKIELKLYSIGFGVTLFSLIFAAVIMWNYFGKTSRLLNGIRLHIAYLTNGVYHYKIKNKYFKRDDEIGAICRDLERMQSATIEMIQDIKYATDNINNKSKSLNDVSEILSKTTIDISDAIKNIVKGISEESSDIINILEKNLEFNTVLGEQVNDIQKALAMAKEIEDNAIRSNRDLLNLSNSIKSFDSIFKTFLGTLNEMNRDIKKVNNITDLINNVAEQTNLLALNAAIEAARSGEAGKGFTVVAEEIRILSEQTKNASISINNLTTVILNSSMNLKKDTENMSYELTRQKDGVQEAAESFNIISHSISKITPMLYKITEDSNCICETNNLIMKNLEVLSSVNDDIYISVDRISNHSENTKNTSTDLLKHAKDLKNTANTNSNYINKFIIYGPASSDIER
ncbi:MAG: methyl-accepting chemotaxis protein [Clostridium sp.]|uniref:methyl-accepting chemotaxis protein n=1 Tax=Clostridium sp. TaxID=1506 RepID=UPI003F2B824F